MKVGSLVFATDQGLGVLAKSLYDAGIITDVLTVAHGRRQEHREWYPGSGHLSTLRGSGLKQAEDFCKSMDVMLFLETPFIWELIPFCRDHGVKTALMPMYECMPTVLPFTPDIFLNPSQLDQQYYPMGVLVPVPPVKVQWRQRTEAKVFVHNAGHGGLSGRNGTLQLFDALRLIKSPAEFIIRRQYPNGGGLPSHYDELWFNTGKQFDYHNIKLTLQRDTSFDTLYSEGDVFLFPEQFNGLSLPLQEAHAAGMAVMCLDRFPMHCWLPKAPLIPVSGYRKDRVAGRCNEFDRAIVDPQDIAAKVDEWYGKNIMALSMIGKYWGEMYTWEKVRPVYQGILSSL